ncbi:unnamed protein product [Parnassius apollo]|uniref:15-hydroxyprostaglandin dehydrogenase [NAD(+)] n=1 Tax=Parnassius apollo TaxID=110799 RepID=A0A8S3XNL8_PARAO|nr:unnamed protein product [Parnassius apollo]
MAKWDVNGKTFMITGAATGLGAGYAEQFLKEGAKIFSYKQIAILDIAEDKGKLFVEELNNTYPGRAIFIKCDVSDEQSIAVAFDEVLVKFGKLDVVINNAGIMNDSPQLWRKMCDVNWQGLVSFTSRAIKHMRKDEGGAGGTIINVASTAALIKTDALPIYCGTKMAVLHFTQCIASGNFYEETGVRCLTICPGPTDTALMVGLTERGSDNKKGEILEQLVNTLTCQKKESAVAAVVKMFKEGTNGSIWLSVNNQPGKDITSAVDEAFDILIKTTTH